MQHQPIRGSNFLFIEETYIISNLKKIIMFSKKIEDLIQAALQDNVFIEQEKEAIMKRAPVLVVVDSYI